MGILFVFLIGFLQFHVVTGQDCSGFKLFDGDREVTNFTCTVYGNEYCEDGPSTFPNNLSVGDSVAKPRDFEAREFRRNYTFNGHVLYLSGMTFTWKPPVAKLSRSHLKGFYMRRLRVGSGTRKCTLIDLQQVNLTTSTMFHFSFELFPIYQNDFVSYLTYLTSLPPPSDLEFEGLMEQLLYTVQPGLNYSRTPVLYPVHWTTWINLKLHEAKGIVEVTFGFPTADSLAEFTQFELQIVEKHARNPLYKQEIHRGLPKETEATYNFTNVPTGIYKVQVQPLDRFRHDLEKCQCWESRPPLITRACDICRFSSTGYFNFSAMTITTTMASRTTATEDAITSTPPTTVTDKVKVGGGGLSAGLTAAVVLISLAGVMAVVVVLYCLHRRGKLLMMRPGCRDVSDNASGPKGRPGWMPKNLPVQIMDITGHDKELKPPLLQQKRIMLLASEDHVYFTRAVDRLAAFLQLHCQCQVTFAPQQMPQLRKASNSCCWLSSQIDSADFVIIITSEAAHRLILAYCEDKAYSQAEWGPEGDLFTPGILHIRGKIAKNNMDNVIMASFKHTSPSFRLPIDSLPSSHYRLPHHLPDLLQHIHGLDKTKMDLSMVNLPLQGKLEELQGGREWLDAMENAEEYEEQNPRWFEQKFGQPSPIKPEFTQQVSHDSGFNDSRNSRELQRQRRLSSASNTAERMGEDADLGLNNSSFNKDDFLAPSVCMTVYTVPYPGDDKPSEIDGTSLTEEFHRLNQQYEQEQQQQQQAAREGPLFNGLPYNPHATQILNPYYSLERGALDYIGYQEVEDQDCISVISAQSV